MTKDRAIRSLHQALQWGDEWVRAYAEACFDAQREIDAMRDQIERLEAQLTTSRAEAELFRAQLLIEGIQPYYTGPMGANEVT